MRHTVLSSLLCASLCAVPAVAAFAKSPLADREPGLWELRLVDGSNLASLALGAQQMLKNLPEAQRQQLEQLMGGKSLNLPTVIQQCLTPQMAQGDLKTQLASHDIQCAELDWQESAGGGRFSFVCTSPEGDWTGQGHILDATARQFRSEANVQGKYHGQRVVLDMHHEARWLGPDCGNVKPPR